MFCFYNLIAFRINLKIYIIAISTKIISYEKFFLFYSILFLCIQNVTGDPLRPTSNVEFIVCRIKWIQRWFQAFQCRM